MSSPVRAPFLSPFRGVCLGGFTSPQPPGPLAPCWYAVATVNPQGNCDSSRAEAHPDYLTRLGAASGTLLTARLLVRSTGTCDRARGAGESCLPARAGFLHRARGAAPTSRERPFPGHPGLSSRPTRGFAAAAGCLCSFNEPLLLYHTTASFQRNLVHNVIHQHTRLHLVANSGKTTEGWSPTSDRRKLFTKNHHPHRSGCGQLFPTAPPSATRQNRPRQDFPPTCRRPQTLVPTNLKEDLKRGRVPAHGSA